MRLFLQEWKLNKKSFLIWTISMIFVCSGCILLFKSVEESIKGIAETYANMGAMSAAFGMDKVSIATIDGYYATEISTMFNLGSALFAALLGIGMLSKEEACHTAEFLNTLPLSRIHIYISKYIASLSLLAAFHLLILATDLLSLKAIGTIDGEAFLLYHLASFIMQIEILTVCYMISAFSKKTLTGVGLGLAILFYAADMMCRIVPDLEDCKYLTPYYFCSGADIFSEKSLNGTLIGISCLISVLAFAIGLWKYQKKDINS